ncbi:matrixin family metalloprotease [Candidatus Parcubacteria bacterium]|nr:matrixin family metalloprotease [Candidatus Parcubacteria bacterium]
MRWLAVAAVVLFSPAIVLATPLEKATIEEHLAEADVVAHGLIASVSSEQAGHLILTAVTLEVASFIRGSFGMPFNFYFIGGTAGDWSLKTAEAPAVEVGDEVIVFLTLHEGRLWLRDGIQGYWRVIEKHGRRIATRDLRSVRFLLPQGPTLGSAEEIPFDALPEPFRSLPVPNRGGFSKEFKRNQTQSGRFAWWAIRNMPVPFRLDAAAYAAWGLTDTPRLETTLQQALQTWNDTPTYLTLRYAGQSSVRPEVPDQTNVISLKAMSATNPRTGGMAYYWANRQTGEIADCDIELNRDRPELARLEIVKQIWTHELGHCAGLGHSEDQTAIMYPEGSPDRGNALAPDDIAGLQRIYPEPRRPSDDPMPEVYIWPPSSPQPAGPLSIEIQILNPGGRTGLRGVYLGADSIGVNRVDYSWLISGQRGLDNGYPTPHGWVFHFPAVPLPMPGLNPLRIKVCGLSDSDTEGCQSATYTLR